MHRVAPCPACRARRRPVTRPLPLHTPPPQAPHQGYPSVLNILLQHLVFQSIPTCVPILSVPGREAGQSRPPPCAQGAQKSSRSPNVSPKIAQKWLNTAKIAQKFSLSAQNGSNLLRPSSLARKLPIWQANISTVAPILSVGDCGAPPARRRVLARVGPGSTAAAGVPAL